MVDITVATRNKKKIFTELFGILRNVASQEVDYDLHPSLYVNTSDEEDNLIENCQIESIHYDSGSMVYLLLKYKDITYYCFSGSYIDATSVNSDYFMEETELYKGIWTLVQSQYLACCRSDASGTNLYDEILYCDDDMPKRAKEINIDEIIHYFHGLNVFKVINDTVYHSDDLYRIKGYFDVTLNNSILPFSDDAQSNYLSLFSSGIKSIPLDLVYLSFSSSQYKQSFVELYRCIEQLYPVPALKELLTVGGTTSNCPLEVAVLLEDKINWRPKGSDAISLLYKDLDISISNKIEIIKIGTEYSSLNGSGFLYKLRNANVHFRKKLGRGELPNEKWESLIEVMLEAILNLYGKYDSQIN